MTAPLALVGLAFLSALYVHGAWRRGARQGRAQPVGRWRIASFLGGTAVVAVALGSPLHHAAETSLAAHMVQHLLLLVVAAPSIAFGRPMVVLSASGSPVRPVVRRLAPVVRWLLERPLHVGAVHAAVVWLWHLPAPYEAALANPLVHAFEHLTLLAAGVLFWLVIAEPDPARLGSISAVGYLFAAAMQCGVLGALLTLSETLWYPASASAAAAESLADQQLAGVLMWVPTGLVYLGATLAVVAKSLRVADGNP